MGQQEHSTEFSRRRPVSMALTLGVILALLFGAACESNPKQASLAFAASGRRYMTQKEYGQAAVQFRNALQQNPSNWQARYELAQAESLLHDWPASYRDLNAVIKVQPSFVPALLDLAQIELMGGRADLARLEIDEALKLKPGNFRAEVLEMKFDLNTKKFQAARKQCGLLRSRKPKDASVYGMCGLGDLGLKDLSAAGNDFRHALALDPSSASETRNLTNVLQLEGHPKQAETLLTGAAQKYPNSLEMQLVLADYYVRHSEIQDADSLLSGLSQHRPAFPKLASTLGDFWMSHNELTRAIADYQMAEASHPDPAIERNLASAYLTLRQVPAAERYTQIILKRDPQSLDGQALEGALDYLKGNYSQSSQLLHGVLKDNPDSLVAKFYLGMTYFATGQLDRAKGAFTDCIRMNDKFLQAYVKLGQIALEQGDWRLGAAYAQRVYQVNPTSSDAYLLLAQADLMHNNLAQAGRVIEAVEKIPSAPVQVHQVAARYDILKRDFKAANKEFQLATSESPNALPIIRLYVAQLVAAGQTPRAITSLQSWMAKTKPTPEASDLLAGLYLDAGELDQAEATARQALTQNPQMAAAHDVLGQVFERRHQPGQAAAEYSASIRLDPHQVQAYLLAGSLSMSQGDYSQAQTEYQSALNEAPTSDSAKLGLAEALGARGTDLDQALGIAQGLKSRYPNGPRVADALGWIYHQKGFQPLALPQLEQAAQALPDDPTIQFHFGMTLMAAGHKLRGHEVLSRALKLGLLPSDQSIAERALGMASTAQAKTR